MNNETKIQICRDDFYLMLQNAMTQAGGTMKLENMKKMPLELFVDVIAMNGLRMVYMPEKRGSSLQVTWGPVMTRPEGFRRTADASRHSGIIDAFNEVLIESAARDPATPANGAGGKAGPGSGGDITKSGSGSSGTPTAHS